MSLTIITTPGDPAANSYNSDAELDAVASEILPEPVAWTKAEQALRDRLKVSATRALDAIPVPGNRVTIAQVLEHPRIGLLGYSRSAIAAPVKQAHARAVFFLASMADRCIDPFTPSNDAGVSAIKYGSELDLTFEKGATSTTPWDRFVCAVIQPILDRLQPDPSQAHLNWTHGTRSARATRFAPVFRALR